MAKRQLRSHIPPLPPDKLAKAIAALGVARISNEGRIRIEQSLRAAANPNAERIDVVISTLDPARKQHIEQTSKGIANLTKSRMQRGRERLLALQNFDELVEEANRD